VKRAIAIAVLLLLAAIPAFAQCSPTLAYSAMKVERSYRVWTITFHDCGTLPVFTAGSDGKLILGTSQYNATVDSFIESTVLTPNPTLTLIQQTGGELDPLDAYYSTQLAEFTYTALGVTTTWTLNPLQPLNEKSYAFKFGPASAGDQTGQGTPGQSITAFRLNFAANYSHASRRGATSDKSWFSKIQRDAAVQVDTTDQKSGFIDNSSLAAGGFIPQISLGRLLSQGKIGAQIKYERPIHVSNHNLDATATVTGGVPLFQAVNLFSSKRTLAEPLQLSLSYGYRSQRMTTSTYRGRVFEGSARYHMYLFTDYRVDLRATTTYNDLNNLAPNTPKTTHQFAAQILYRSTPSGPFGVVASFENGSFGPVLSKLRQYFIGVAIQNVTRPFQTP
jgi:hypothetical protein